MNSSNATPTFADWLEGARLRTLPAAVAPVLAGTGAAGADANFGRAVLAAIVALALQIGVNFANDYSDGVRGTDKDRVGPTRLTATGLVAPARVKRIAFAWFGLGAVAGLALIVISHTWWLLPAGAAALVAAWYYTGGKKPYGYRGLGEVSVFIFFGLVATWGTTYTQAHALPGASIFAGLSMGFVACALLMINNIRDIPTDTVSGKRTLAVRLGDSRARVVYAAFMASTILTALAAALVFGFAKGAVVPVAVAALVVIGLWAGALSFQVLRGGAAMIPTLRNTGLIQLAIGVVLLVVGLVG